MLFEILTVKANGYSEITKVLLELNQSVAYKILEMGVLENETNGDTTAGQINSITPPKESLDIMEKTSDRPNTPDDKTPKKLTQIPQVNQPSSTWESTILSYQKDEIERRQAKTEKEERQRLENERNERLARLRQKRPGNISKKVWL